MVDIIKCHKCSGEVSIKDNFCMFCGTSLMQGEPTKGQFIPFQGFPPIFCTSPNKSTLSSLRANLALKNILTEKYVDKRLDLNELKILASMLQIVIDNTQSEKS